VIGFWSAFGWLVGMTVVIALLSDYVVSTIEVRFIRATKYLLFLHPSSGLILTLNVFEFLSRPLLPLGEFQLAFLR